jgi:hypothetical protein
MDHSRLQAPELDEKSAAILDASRQQLRSHFKDRGEDERRRQVGEWKAENVYPFNDEPDTATESASRELFDVVAVTARDAVNAGETRSKALSLRLLREAIEQNPGSLRRVLNEVLGLSEDDLEELDKLLDQTSLPKLIAASRAITNRLDFLAGLEHLVLDKEIKTKLLERSQLHRILADETWFFGEEFALTADDESLNAVLKAHIHLLGRSELAPEEHLEPVQGAGDRKRAIVDLMLAREIPQSRNRLEHLVVELKRPSVAIGPKELQQVRDYASAVASDDRFDKSEVEWDFIAVSTALAGTVEEDANQAGQPKGLTNTYKQGRVRVWAKTWGELIEDARHRHKFVQGPARLRAFGKTRVPVPQRSTCGVLAGVRRGGAETGPRARGCFPRLSRHPVALARQTGPFTGPRSGKTALQCGKIAYVPACKAVYTSSILVGAFRFASAFRCRRTWVQQ